MIRFMHAEQETDTPSKFLYGFCYISHVIGFKTLKIEYERDCRTE